MKRLLLGISLTVFMTTVAVNAAPPLTTVTAEVQTLVRSLEITNINDARTVLSQAYTTGKIPAAALATFNVLHADVQKGRSSVKEIQAIAEKHSFSLNAVLGVATELKGSPFNEANVAKTTYLKSYTASLAKSQAVASSAPAARVAVSTEANSEAGLVALAQNTTVFSGMPEVQAAIKDNASCGSNQCRSIAAATGRIVASLKTACSGVEDKTCPAIAVENAGNYIAKHVIPGAKDADAQKLSLLAVGINAPDHLDAAKTGISPMALHLGLRNILKRPASLREGNLKACGEGEATELSTYALTM